MTLEQLITFIDLQHQRLIEQYGANTESEQTRVLSRTVKLTEEVGELCSEVLATYKDQRPEKLEQHKPEDLSHEFADVIITTLLLAKSMKVDIPQALQDKIDKINKRYELR